MPRPKIVVVGSANTDLILQVPRLPRPGETVLGGAFTTAAGGKGANQAVAAARAGGAVTFVGRVGHDSFGATARRGLRADGIDCRFLRIDRERPSGVALILVAAGGRNSIAVAAGANGNLSPADLSQARRPISSASILLLQLETPLSTVQAAAELGALGGARVILNPAPAARLGRRLLEIVSVLTPNETETESLTGKRDPRRAARVLLAQGVQTVIVTLGARGALLASKEGETLIPAFAVKAVDTTAAGDVFNGALAVALAEGIALCDAVRFANAAAALAVTKLGAQASAPSRAQIERLLARRR